MLPGIDGDALAEDHAVVETRPTCSRLRNALLPETSLWLTTTWRSMSKVRTLRFSWDQTAGLEDPCPM